MFFNQNHLKLAELYLEVKEVLFRGTVSATGIQEIPYLIFAGL